MWPKSLCRELIGFGRAASRFPFLCRAMDAVSSSPERRPPGRLPESELRKIPGAESTIESPDDVSAQGRRSLCGRPYNRCDFASPEVREVCALQDGDLAVF